MFGAHTEEEDASTLTFGKDFDNIECLTLDEVKIILERQKDRGLQDAATNPVFRDTIAYIDRVTSDVDLDTVRAVAQELRATLIDLELTTRSGEKSKLAQFEVALLSNLFTMDHLAEEILVWIPSLQRFHEEHLNSIIETLTRIKGRLPV